MLNNKQAWSGRTVEQEQEQEGISRNWAMYLLTSSIFKCLAMFCSVRFCNVAIHRLCELAIRSDLSLMNGSGTIPPKAMNVPVSCGFRHWLCVVDILVTVGVEWVDRRTDKRRNDGMSEREGGKRRGLVSQSGKWWREPPQRSAILLYMGDWDSALVPVA